MQSQKYSQFRQSILSQKIVTHNRKCDWGEMNVWSISPTPIQWQNKEKKSSLTKKSRQLLSLTMSSQPEAHSMNVQKHSKHTFLSSQFGPVVLQDMGKSYNTIVHRPTNHTMHLFHCQHPMPLILSVAWWILWWLFIIWSKTLAVFPDQRGSNPDDFPWHFDQRFFSIIPTQNALDASMLAQFRLACHRQSTPCVILPHQETVANMMRIRHIQYIARTIGTETIPYFFTILQSISSLSPYRSDPYRIALLIWPINKSSPTAEPIKEQTRRDSYHYAQSWILFLCDQNKLSTIRALPLSGLDHALATKEQNDLINPCLDKTIPYYLGFNAFHFLGNPQEASSWYAISAFDENPVPMAASMASTVLTQTNNRRANITIWLARLDSDTITNPSIATAQASLILGHIAHNTILFLIEETASRLGQTCFHDITCMRTTWAIQETIKQRKKICATNPDDVCIGIDLALRLWRIDTKNQRLIHPFHDQTWLTTYGRDSERNQRWPMNEE